MTEREPDPSDITSESDRTHAGHLPPRAQVFTLTLRTALEGQALFVRMWDALEDVADSLELRPVMPELVRLREENERLQRDLGEACGASFEGARRAGERVGAAMAEVERLAAAIQRAAESTGC